MIEDFELLNGNLSDLKSERPMFLLSNIKRLIHKTYFENSRGVRGFLDSVFTYLPFDDVGSFFYQIEDVRGKAQDYESGRVVQVEKTLRKITQSLQSDNLNYVFQNMNQKNIFYENISESEEQLFLGAFYQMKTNLCLKLLFDTSKNFLIEYSTLNDLRESSFEKKDVLFFFSNFARYFGCFMKKDTKLINCLQEIWGLIYSRKISMPRGPIDSFFDFRNPIKSIKQAYDEPKKEKKKTKGLLVLVEDSVLRKLVINKKNSNKSEVGEVRMKESHDSGGSISEIGDYKFYKLLDQPFTKNNAINPNVKFFKKKTQIGFFSVFDPLKIIDNSIKQVMTPDDFKWELLNHRTRRWQKIENRDLQGIFWIIMHGNRGPNEAVGHIPDAFAEFFFDNFQNNNLKTFSRLKGWQDLINKLPHQRINLRQYNNHEVVIARLDEFYREFGFLPFKIVIIRAHVILETDSILITKPQCGGFFYGEPRISKKRTLEEDYVTKTILKMQMNAIIRDEDLLMRLDNVAYTVKSGYELQMDRNHRTDMSINKLAKHYIEFHPLNEREIDENFLLLNGKFMQQNIPPQVDLLKFDEIFSRSQDGICRLYNNFYRYENNVMEFGGDFFDNKKGKQDDFYFNSLCYKDAARFSYGVEDCLIKSFQDHVLGENNSN